MKKFAFTCVILTAAWILSACNLALNPVISSSVAGSGNVVVQDVPIGEIDSVMLSGLGDLTIRQGETESLTIEAEDNILPLLETKVTGGVLELSDKPNTSINSSKGIHYTLVVMNLKQVSLTGMGNIAIDALTADALNLVLSGSGDVKMTDLQAGEVNLTLDGLGSIELTGQAESLTMKTMGSGDLKAADLKVKNASITIEGLGNATVQVSDTLEVNISGSGSLKYYGAPKITQEITGLGSIQSLGEK